MNCCKFGPRAAHRQISDDQQKFDKPVFVAPLTGTSVVAEGQSAHMECRVLPHNDASLKINWFKNGEALQVNPFLIFLFVKLQITIGKINEN
jgi:hypothetical protein